MPVTLTTSDQEMLDSLCRDRTTHAHAQAVSKKEPCFGAYWDSRPRTVIFGKGNIDSDPCSRLHVALLHRLLRHNGIKVLSFGVHYGQSWAMRVDSPDTELLGRAVEYCHGRAIGWDDRHCQQIVGELRLDLPQDFGD